MYQGPLIDCSLKLLPFPLSSLHSFIVTFDQLFLKTRCGPERVVLVHEVVERLTELSRLAVLLTNGPRLQRVDACVRYRSIASISVL